MNIILDSDIKLNQPVMLMYIISFFNIPNFFYLNDNSTLGVKYRQFLVICTICMLLN